MARTTQGAALYRHGENDTSGSKKMIGVIDTSALVRLFIPDGPIPEGFEEFLSGAERGNNKAIAPELLLVESANVLNRKRKMDELSEVESLQLLTDVLS
ncbi:MAG: type II toxin-antitoxin system VapC family toxin, partial [Desulfobacterales bacterium]